MATSIAAAGSGNLLFRDTVFKGQVSRHTSMIANIAFPSSMQNQLSSRYDDDDDEDFS